MRSVAFRCLSEKKNKPEKKAVIVCRWGLSWKTTMKPALENFNQKTGAHGHDPQQMGGMFIVVGMEK